MKPYKFLKINSKILNILGSSAATPVTSANTSPISGRNSLFQNDNAGDNHIEPPNMSAANIQVITQNLLIVL